MIWLETPEIGAKIAAELRRTRRDVAWLVRATTLGRATLDRLVKHGGGKHKPDPTTLSQVAAALGWHYDWVNVRIGVPDDHPLATQDGLELKIPVSEFVADRLQALADLSSGKRMEQIAAELLIEAVTLKSQSRQGESTEKTESSEHAEDQNGDAGAQRHRPARSSKRQGQRR